MLFDDLLFTFVIHKTVCPGTDTDSRTCVERHKEGNDQETIQSSTTPNPGYQVFFNSDNVTVIKTDISVKKFNGCLIE